MFNKSKKNKMEKEQKKVENISVQLCLEEKDKMETLFHISVAINNSNKKIMLLDGSTSITLRDLYQLLNEEQKNLDNIAHNTKLTTDHSKEISNELLEMEKISKENKGFVEDGITPLTKLTANSNESLQSFVKTNEVIKTLHESLNEISSLSKEINGIAEKTNLLSLNASIEAARAGESGKGFAVVANEVKQLAESSKETAAKINNLILKSSSAIETVQKNSDKNIKYAKEQNDNITISSEMFKKIENSSSEINDKVVILKQFIEETTQISNSVFNSLEETVENFGENTKKLNEIIKFDGEKQGIQSSTHSLIQQLFDLIEKFKDKECRYEY